MKSLLTSIGAMSLDDSSPTDPDFERLVEELTAALQDGESIDLTRLAENHPQYVEQIRDLLPAMEMLARIGEAPITRPETNGDAPHLPQHQLGDFQIIRELGRGGMGVVYEADQISLGRRVALKVLPFTGMLDQQQLARFKNEARAAATLHHPNIVPIHAVGSDRGVHFYAMQLVEGQSLAQVIEQLKVRSENRGTRTDQAQSDIRMPDAEIATPSVGRLSTVPDVRSRESWHTVARLGIEAADALDHAHQNGVLHRDIKPANLLVDNFGKLWITDFGLARMEADAGMTMTGDLLGTLRYMSPEQALAKRVVVDHRSDVYSLGATLYELLALQPAFGETDRSELLKRIAFDEPRPPRQIVRQIPVELETIVLKAMRKSPDERYASAHDLAEDLQSFLDNKPIKAKPPTWRELAVKWSRRHPAAIWATVLVLLATTVVSAVSAVLVVDAYQREAMHRKQAEAERERSDENFRRSIAVSNDVLNASFGMGEWASLPSNLRDKLAEQARQHYELLLKESSSDPKLQFENAVMYGSLAEMHHRRSNPGKAEPLFRQSVAIFEHLCREHPKSFAYHQLLALANLRLGATLISLGHHDEAKSRLETSFSIYRDVVLMRDDGDWRQALNCANELAKELEWRGDTGSAQFEVLIVTCEELVARNPMSAFARGSLASLMARHGSYDQAIAEYRQAIRLDPNRPTLRNGFGLVLQSHGLVDEAIAEFREAMRLDPAEPEIHSNLAHALSNKGLYEEAIAEYREASRLQPSNPRLHFNLGSMLIERELLDEGIVELREALRLDPKDSQYHSQLAYSLLEAGAIDEAISAGREAVRINPTEAVGHNNLSKPLAVKGMMDEAVIAIREAVRLDPDDSIYRHNLGAALYGQGLLDEAISEFHEAIRLEPGEAMYHHKLGQALARKGLVDEAISAFREAIRLNPDEAVFHYDCGNAFHTKGLLPEATEEYKKAIAAGREQIRSKPHASDPLAMLARTLGNCRDTSLRIPQEAVTLAEEAVKLMPLEGNNWFALGAAHYRAGKYRRAVEALLKSRELNGVEPSSMYFLAMAEWQLGNRDAARVWFAEGDKWLKEHPQVIAGEHHRFRAEAEALLGTTQPGQLEARSASD